MYGNDLLYWNLTIDNNNINSTAIVILLFI